ncbi:MAG: response regulator [Candidatus Aenigmarchaeota archaeon]|nr:response regulator [Candidatus Aenigmarchaeota archaeon]
MADVVYRKKILSIDDNREIADFLRPKFEEAGYDFDAAYNGPEGLARMKSYKPDLVLLDIMMPIIDGFEVLKRAKADDEIKGIPIVMLTAKHQRVDVLRALQLGAKDYLVKPMNIPRILEKVGKVLVD